MARKKAHERDNLFFNPERGVWYWRKVHNKKRVIRNTGQKQRGLARREAAKFEDQLAAERAGVKTFDEFRGALVPLVDEWIKSLKNADLPPQEKTLTQKKRETLRALEALGLKTAADLTHVGRVNDKLRALEGVSRLTMRRCYQDQLKQFSRWLAENGRYLPEDPLRSWKPIRVPREERGKPRRAFMPADVARALAALDVLDRQFKRVGSSRLVFTALLVTAPRAEAIVTRDVVHFDPRASRINYGLGVGNKARGAGALDPTTAAEIKAAAKGRKADEPLFLSPHGTRWPKERLLDVWKQAFSLGLVADLWPAGEPAGTAEDLEAAVFTSRALLTGHVRVSKGGNPEFVLTADTVRERLDLELRVSRLVEAMRADWQARIAGIDVHSFRTNLQTWCEAQGVPRPAIDRQLGHDGHGTDGSMDVLRAIAGSRTGRKHYLDMNSELFDPAKTAAAVRALVDDAEAQLRADGSMLLAQPKDAAEA